MQGLGPMMQQMLGPQGNNQTMAQMAQSMGGEVGEENQSVVLKLMEELTMQETMNVYTGNFAAIQGLAKRFQDRLIRELRQNTPERRRAMAEDEVERLCRVVKVGGPGVRAKPGVRIVEKVKGVASIHVPIILEKVLDFNTTRSDQDFFNLLKDNFSDFLGETVELVKDDFEGGEKDAVNFVVFNGQEGLKVLGGDMGDMMAMMGGQLVTKYVNNAISTYSEMKLLGITRLQMERKDQEEENKEQHDTEMKEEEEKKETEESVKRREFLKKWQATIEADEETIVAQQRPLSRPYKQTCPFTVEKKQGQALVNDQQNAESIKKTG